MSSSGPDFATRVVGAATQGAVGAVVAASLAAVTEPIVNRVLLNRVPLATAIKEIKPSDMKEFLKTTIPTNFIKFPFFEAVNVIMQSVELPASVRGSVTGAVFCTVTLPITNYRFKKSIGQTVGLDGLYQAYLPTVFRDVIYGIVRNNAGAYLIGRDPVWAATDKGRFVTMWLTVFASTVLSAPGNELRAFTLQRPDQAKPFTEFFQPMKSLRSTTIGSLIMSFSLAIGALATPRVQRLWETIRQYLRENPSGYILLVLWILHQWYANQRHSQLVKALEDTKDKKATA